MSNAELYVTRRMAPVISFPTAVWLRCLEPFPLRQADFQYRIILDKTLVKILVFLHDIIA